MSTIDPVRRARERRQARVGSTGAAIAVLLADLVVLAGGALSGWAATGEIGLGGLRDSALNHFFADSGQPPDLDVATLPAAIVVTMVGGVLLTAAARAYTGQIMSFPVVGPLTLWLGGLAVGLAAGVRRWPPPVTVGVRTDPTFGDDEVWSSVDWAWYHADDWIPWIAVGLALLSLVIGVVGRRGRAARRRELDRLLVEGQRAVGDVTAIPTLTEGSALLASWTVHFVDRSATDRWVTSSGRFARDELPRVGDRVSVLYDAASPGDRRRIYLGPLQARTAADFLRWRA